MQNKFYSPPMCSCCGKLGTDIKPIIIDQSGKSAYWFIFKELNLKTVANSQNIDDILNCATKEFPIEDVETDEAPDAHSYNVEQKRGKKLKIEYMVDDRPTFNYNYEVNLLCPVCATSYIESKVMENQKDSGNFGDFENPESEEF